MLKAPANTLINSTNIIRLIYSFYQYIWFVHYSFYLLVIVGLVRIVCLCVCFCLNRSRERDLYIYIYIFIYALSKCEGFCVCVLLLNSISDIGSTGSLRSMPLILFLSISHWLSNFIIILRSSLILLLRLFHFFSLFQC